MLAGFIGLCSQCDEHVPGVYPTFYMLVQLDWPSMSTGAYAGIWAADVRFQFRVQIQNPDENYTRDFRWIFEKSRIEFADFFVSALWCNWNFFSISTFCINHGSVAVVSRRVGPRWWQMRAFWKAQNHPLPTRPSRACREVVNMLREAVDRDGMHGAGE